MDYAPSACDPLERGVKQSPPTSFTRSALLLSILAQKHLARSKKQKPTGKSRRALFVGDTVSEPLFCNLLKYS
jgi:hypothetical protein